MAWDPVPIGYGAGTPVPKTVAQLAADPSSLASWVTTAKTGGGQPTGFFLTVSKDVWDELLSTVDQPFAGRRMISLASGEGCTEGAKYWDPATDDWIEITETL